MTTVLGIDAAWTPTEPSGVALIQGDADRWTCIALAPSYHSFVGAADGSLVDWNSHAVGTPPDPAELLSAARSLAGTPIDLVAIDMPISTVAILGRRTADNETSKRFGPRGCSTHSATPERPGSLGAKMTGGFAALGYPVATADTEPGAPRHLLEVYPHPALLALLGRAYRVPYKLSRSRRYWPDQSVPQRIQSLLVEHSAIEAGLRRVIRGIPTEVQPPRSVARLSALKRHEDALDALVACWVGSLYATGRSTPLGDDTAAIWFPTAAFDLPPLISPSQRPSGVP